MQANRYMAAHTSSGGTIFVSNKARDRFVNLHIVPGITPEGMNAIIEKIEESSIQSILLESGPLEIFDP